MNLQPEQLENETVRLIPLTTNDFGALYSVASDPMIWEQHPATDRYKKDVFQNFFDGAVKSRSAFLVVDKKSGKVIGSTRFYDYNSDRSSIAIGYTFLAKEYWGGQYNQAAKRLLLDYAFQFVESVFFHIGSENLRSQKAILKLGAIKVKEMDMDFNGKILPHHEYLISKSEWQKN